MDVDTLCQVVEVVGRGVGLDEAAVDGVDVVVGGGPQGQQKHQQTGDQQAQGIENAGKVRCVRGLPRLVASITKPRAKSPQYPR